MPKPILYLLPTFAFLAGERVTTITRNAEGERVETVTIEDGKLDLMFAPADGRPAWHDYIDQPEGDWGNADVITAAQALHPEYSVVLKYPERTVDLTEDE